MTRRENRTAGNEGTIGPQRSIRASQVAALRLRASKCRFFAREYAADVGSSLSELAIELDKKADRMETMIVHDAVEAAHAGKRQGNVDVSRQDPVRRRDRAEEL